MYGKILICSLIIGMAVTKSHPPEMREKVKEWQELEEKLKDLRKTGLIADGEILVRFAPGVIEIRCDSVEVGYTEVDTVRKRYIHTKVKVPYDSLPSVRKAMQFQKPPAPTIERITVPRESVTVNLSIIDSIFTILKVDSISGLPGPSGIDTLSVNYEGDTVMGFPSWRRTDIFFPRNIPITEAIKLFFFLPDSIIRRVNPLHTPRWEEPTFTLSNDKPNDPDFSKQWGLEKIQCPKAWEIQKGRWAISIAIIDRGVDTEHEDLKSKITVGGDEGYETAHGTRLAGIAAAATNNNLGIAGVGWENAIIPFRIEGEPNEKKVAGKVDQAVRSAARVILVGLVCYSRTEIPELEAACKFAETWNKVIVVGAGNKGVECPYDEEGHSWDVYPCKYEWVISVGATDENDNRCSFSNYGNWLKVMAPGVDILTTAPGNRYENKTGTSMAAAFVAGVAALAYSQYGTVSAELIRDQIYNTADDIGPPRWDKFTGHGRVNAGKTVPVEDVFEITEPDGVDDFADQWFTIE